jgi:mRNA-capping enzyme
MVIDEVGSERFPRYLVYDIIRFEGLEVGKTDFCTRLVCIQKEIVGARNSYITSVRSYTLDSKSYKTWVVARKFYINTGNNQNMQNVMKAVLHTEINRWSQKQLHNIGEKSNMV